VGPVARREDKINSYRVFVGKSEGKRPLQKPSHRWEDTIKMDLQKEEQGAWIGLFGLRIVNGGWFLGMRLRTSGFHKMWRIS